MEKVPPLIREFFDSRGHLSISNGLLTYGYHSRHVRRNTGTHPLGPPRHKKVPRTCQSVCMVGGNFKGDQGKNRVMSLLSGTPAISKEEATNHLSSTQLVMQECVHRPIRARWQEIPGCNGLYYSRFIEALSLAEMTSQVVIQKLKSVFVRWGIPEELVSDNATQFKSALFGVFKATCEFKHTASSSYHHQANGAAESGVRISKRILKQEEPFLALILSLIFIYCATPIQATGKTPPELIMGRQIKYFSSNHGEGPRA